VGASCINARLWDAARSVGLASRWPFPVGVQIIEGQQMYVDLRVGYWRGSFATGAFEKALEALPVDLSHDRAVAGSAR
jgi:hypothetical protein